MKTKTNRNYLRGILSLLIGTLLLAAMPTDAEAKIYDDTLRLHILANSDSDEDQALKIAVRDRLLEEYGTVFSECQTLAEAEALTEGQIDAIRTYAESYVRELGYSYPVSVSLSTEGYDTRSYEGFTLPAGNYRSLRVIIGEGEGHNWWCVMYPPLCLDVALDDAPGNSAISRYSEEEVRLIGGKPTQIRFKTLEILSDVFRKKG